MCPTGDSIRHLQRYHQQVGRGKDSCPRAMGSRCEGAAGACSLAHSLDGFGTRLGLGRNTRISAISQDDPDQDPEDPGPAFRVSAE